MYLIVGLGNPGAAYRSSRHNAGFRAVDALAGYLKIRVVRRAHSALIGEGNYAGQRVMLMKPQTYMNLSGESVASAVAYYKVPPACIVVLYDDIELPVGTLRIRSHGSAGTHNGMRSIIACLHGEENFPRVRIGVGRQQPGANLARHVLGRPGAQEAEALSQAIADAAGAALLIVEGKLADAQAEHNKKTKTRED
ncbi:MAG: aminoacyl-tRNA hydrolase [Clostridiales bacterium]|jgi:PTH1 family peptidyl-tRNA hydrolase|nr:aminoacyl-tRNA hydrolase [Clostridiales bacterium]